MKKILMSVSMLAFIAVAVAGATYAYFSDSETSVGNTFTAGTLSLDGTGFATFDLGTIDPMGPGDVTEDAVITIKNDGTMPLAWFGNLIVSDSKLKEALYIDYAKMEFLDDNGGADWETADAFIVDGNYLYSDTYETPFGKVSLKAWDGNGDMAPGTPYEHMGALKPGYSYRLTLRFGFAPLAGNDYQGNKPDVTPVTVSFKVDATQVNAGAMEALHATLGNHLDWANKQLAKQGAS